MKSDFETLFLPIFVVCALIAFIGPLSISMYFHHEETVLKIEVCKSSNDVTECLKELK